MSAIVTTRECIKEGDRINSFTIISLASPGRLGVHKRWNIRCQCGKEFNKSSNDIKRQVSCGCHMNKFDPVRTMYSYLLRRHARFAGEPVSFDEFAEHSIANCFYCDTAPANNFSGWAYSGIDRIDSARGYIVGNVRPSCWICNRMKNDLTEEEFFAHIKTIYHYQLATGKTLAQVRAAFEAGKPFT